MIGSLSSIATTLWLEASINTDYAGHKRIVFIAWMRFLHE